MAMNSVLSFIEQEDSEFGFIAIEPEILSQWELVNVSDSDASSELSDADDVAAAISASGCISVVQEVADYSDPYDPSRSISVGDADFTAHIANLVELPRIAYFENRKVREYGERDEDKDNEDEDEDDDGLDDELVPRYLSGKLVRQRMRKLGKRGYAKMNSSKKVPHMYMKPGCVQGKHGLGLKHNLF